MAPPPVPPARFKEKESTAPNPFAGSFLIESTKRHRTLSDASAEAVDGTDAGLSTMAATYPTNSTQPGSPIRLPQRDPLQAVYAWRNREQGKTLQRAKARRQRPGVHFEGYEDHPQAGRHRVRNVVVGGERIFG